MYPLPLSKIDELDHIMIILLLLLIIIIMLALLLVIVLLQIPSLTCIGSLILEICLQKFFDRPTVWESLQKIVSLTSLEYMVNE